VFDDVSLAAALVDRLMHHGQVFYLKGPSWRTRGQTVGQPPTPEAAG
jgi:DNA replication protein DnaC